MENTMKRLVLKDWLWQKIARENGVGPVWGGNVDCVFAETEKAYKVVMGAVRHTVITWVPKSQVEWTETDNEALQTVTCASYEEAMDRVHFLRSAC